MSKKKKRETRDPRELKPYPENVNVYGEIRSDPEFEANIDEFGLQEPVHILPDNTILSGHRRATAVICLKWLDVPVIVHYELEDDPDGAREFWLVSNEHRVKTVEQRLREFAVYDEMSIRKRRLAASKLGGIARHSGNVMTAEQRKKRHLKNQETTRKRRLADSRKYHIPTMLIDIQRKLLAKLDELDADGNVGGAAKLRALMEHGATTKIAAELLGGGYARSVESKKRENSAISSIRTLENKYADEKRATKQEKQKRELAEAELREAKDRINTLEGTQGEFFSKEHVHTPIEPTGEATAIICLNDWHCNKRINPEEIGGLNEFGPEICEKRIERTLDRALTMIEVERHISEIDEVVIWLGGDMINGRLHDEFDETNTMDQNTSIIFAQDQMDKVVRTIERDTDVSAIRVATNNGNHGRTTKKEQTNDWEHSAEYLAYNNLAKHCQDLVPRVQFHISKDIHNLLKIQGRNIRFHHGSQIRYQGGSGGPTIPINKAISAWNDFTDPEYLMQFAAGHNIIGHFHQFMHHRNFTVCGCLCGYDAFAKSIKASFEPPTQTFLVVDRKRGVTVAKQLFCE